MKKDIIFIDLDGTILDVSQRIYQIYKNILKTRNKKFLPESKYLEAKKSGVSLKNILQRTGAEDVLPHFKKEWDKKIESADYLAFDEISSMRKEMLTKIIEDYRLILITSRKNKKNLLFQLKNTGLARFFYKIIFAHFGKKISRRIINKYGGSNPIIVGDGESEMAIGKKLGIKTVAALWGQKNKNILSNYKPDYFVKNPLKLKDAIIKLKNKK